MLVLISANSFHDGLMTCPGCPPTPLLPGSWDTDTERCHLDGVFQKRIQTLSAAKALTTDVTLIIKIPNQFDSCSTLSYTETAESITLKQICFEN